LIEKCYSLKYLYKRIRNKIKPQTANTFVDKNNAIVSNDKQIANEFKEYFETSYSSSITVDENFVQNLISKEGGNKNMNDILKSLKNFDPRKSQGFSKIRNFVFSRCQLSISKFLYVLFDEILKRTEIPVKMKVNSVTPVCKPGKDKKKF
jgi:predicted nuclease of restriction endonuclease-like RecB superfamily